MEKEIADIVKEEIMLGKRAVVFEEERYITYNTIKHLSRLGYQVSVFATPKVHMIVYING